MNFVNRTKCIRRDSTRQETRLRVAEDPKDLAEHVVGLALRIDLAKDTTLCVIFRNRRCLLVVCLEALAQRGFVVISAADQLLPGDLSL